MTRISVRGNDGGNITGSVLVTGSLLFLVLASCWLWAAALERYAEAYETGFRKRVAEQNAEVKAVYEID